MQAVPTETGATSASHGLAHVAWRVVKVSSCGSAFGAFGVGWVLLSHAVLPLLWLWPGSLYARRQRCQRVVGAAWVLFHDYMRWTGLVDFNPRRVPTLASHLEAHGVVGPAVVVANHPSLVDVTALVSGLGPMCFIVKSTLVANPLFGPLLRLTGQVSGGVPSAKDGSVDVVAQAVERLREGHHVLLFPEGTRSTPEQLHRFRLGAFEIARQAGVPVIPVAVRVDPPSLYKGLPWHQITSRTIHFRVRLLPPLRIESDSEGIAATRDLMTRTKAAIVDAAFEQAGA